MRPKTFLTFLALFLLPLLLVVGFTYWGARRIAQRPGDVSADIGQFSQKVTESVDRQEEELVRFAHSPALLEYTESPASRSYAYVTEPPSQFRGALGELLIGQTHFVAVAGFDRSKRQLFLAERYLDRLVFRDKDFLPGQMQPDEQSWMDKTPVRSGVSRNALRARLQISAPVISAKLAAPVGAVVGEVEVDSLLREAASSGSREIVVTDDTGTILYHPNPAFLHQQFASLPGGAELSQPIRIPDLNLSVAAVHASRPTLSLEQVALAAVLGSFVIAAGAALLFARMWERRTTGMEKVTAGVAAIARGDLNHRIEALSSDAIRPISDNLNLMTAQLREQIARETEARQFQSFVRLSAMLTHDLKNAIEALSLIVSNMERHFDNEAFRADAMKSLNLATQNLRSLVDRLSNPVTTLSGEFKRPQPVDLVPLLNRVIKLTAEPALGAEQIETKFPQSLLALVDAERIEKVIENLILNAVEAMAGSKGKISVAAGTANDGKVFFSVSDTGVGMSPGFIERQLFHPFATTKRRGVGLGLYTCREVVRANGGAIEVDSREGAGTTFRVVLPSAAIEKI
ncbi:MAG: HAMP domain-containing histidine kinase [Acidobacteriota bacterium]|nr:HAMP domain-containing histidine kinase [Acidobacteriota bacterium]